MWCNLPPHFKVYHDLFNWLWFWLRKRQVEEQNRSEIVLSAGGYLIYITSDISVKRGKMCYF